MNKQAFERGFIKAAMVSGIPPLKAVSLLKQANFDFNNTLQALNMVKDTTGAGMAAGLGAGGGALIGGGLGALTGGAGPQDPNHPEQKPESHHLRNALLGALGGGALGAGAGPLLNTNNAFNSYKDQLMQDPINARKSLVAGLPKAEGNSAMIDMTTPERAAKAPVIEQLLNKYKGQKKEIGGQSLWKSLLGQQPINFPQPNQFE